MRHPDPDLLVDAALDAPLPPDVTAHLAECAACATQAQELRRTAQAVRTSRTVEASPPPAHVWSAIAAAIADSGTADVVPLRPPGAARRWSRRALLAACAAGVAVGSLTTYAFTRPAEQPADAPISVAELTPLGQTRLVGRAQLVSSGAAMDLRVQTEPLDPGPGYLEVWLINRDLTRMISIGVLPAGVGTRALPVTPRAIDEGYVIVDISREGFDDKPQHSGQTLARGTLHS